MTSDSSHSSIAPIEHLTIVAAPGFFVILWASGLIGAKLGLPYAEPLTFLSLRMFGAVVLLGAIVSVARPKWPTRARQWGGLLLGIAGVYVVVQDKATTSGATPLAWGASLVALLSITFGTIYQNRSILNEHARTPIDPTAEARQESSLRLVQWPSRRE